MNHSDTSMFGMVGFFWKSLLIFISSFPFWVWLKLRTSQWRTVVYQMHINWRIQSLQSSYALLIAILYVDYVITVFCIAGTLYEHLKTNNTTVR